MHLDFPNPFSPLQPLNSSTVVDEVHGPSAEGGNCENQEAILYEQKNLPLRQFLIYASVTGSVILLRVDESASTVFGP